jgi:hypothetical protein
MIAEHGGGKQHAAAGHTAVTGQIMNSFRHRCAKFKQFRILCKHPGLQMLGSICISETSVSMKGQIKGSQVDS